MGSFYNMLGVSLGVGVGEVIVRMGYYCTSVEDSFIYVFVECISGFCFFGRLGSRFI